MRYLLLAVALTGCAGAKTCSFERLESVISEAYSRGFERGRRASCRIVEGAMITDIVIDTEKIYDSERARKERPGAD